MVDARTRNDQLETVTVHKKVRDPEQPVTSQITVFSSRLALGQRLRTAGVARGNVPTTLPAVKFSSKFFFLLDTLILFFF